MRVRTDLKYVTGMVVLAVLFVSVVTGCAGERRGADAGQALTVTVSVLPQKYFVERIGGEHVQVNVMVGPGDEPHSYEPKPSQMRALSDSVAYFSVGVEFEDAWLDRIASANEDMWVVDTTQGIERIPLDAHHHQGDESESVGEELDPHTWTSPALVKVQARTITEALAQIDPEHEEVYRANLDRFLADIHALETELDRTLGGLEGAQFIVFHPSWGYLARDFGLEQVPVEVEGQEPSARELADLIAMAKREGIRVVFAQPEFSTRAAETIAHEIGGEVLLISPLAPDWLGNMREVANAFARTLGER
jgi:zinc transport system substrate-binding protein